jgi:tetratricopeptide (TPR) repeat protein
MTARRRTDLTLLRGRCDAALAALVVATSVALAACPHGIPAELGADPRELAAQVELPQSAEECVALADRIGVEGASQEDLVRALQALERAEALAGGAVDLWVKQVRLVFLIAGPIASKKVRVTPWLARGEKLAARLKEAAPDRVEGHYYEAAFLGFHADLYRFQALELLPRIVEDGEKAISIDERYDDGGALVLMGMVLIKAPPWPIGVGDEEEGMSLLRRAVEVSDYPVNRIILAKVLLEQEEVDEACQLLDRALLAPKIGRWGKTWQRHRREAWALYNTYRCYRQEFDPQLQPR